MLEARLANEIRERILQHRLRPQEISCIKAASQNLTQGRRLGLLAAIVQEFEQEQARLGLIKRVQPQVEELRAKLAEISKSLAASRQVNRKVRFDLRQRETALEAASREASEAKQQLEKARKRRIELNWRVSARREWLTK